MAGGTIARTAHFALHRLVLASDAAGITAAPSEPGDQPSKVVPQALFAFEATWLGAMVPKRWARRAVTRNAIKRQIFAVAALYEAQLPVAAHVVRLRSTFDRKQFISPSSDVLKQAVRAELMQLFARAHKNSQPAKAERADGAKALSV